jgi:hypothetical protein
LNILVLHDEKELELPKAVARLLKEKSIRVHAKSFGKNWYKKESLLNILADYSHFIVINTVNSESAWESLCLGYAFGIKAPVVILGSLPSYIYKSNVEDYKICKTENDFSDLLNREFPEWIEKDIQKQARNDLLATGIPYNEESFERCVIEENTWAAELFLKAGFLPDAKDKNGVPLLNLAARTGNPKMVKILLNGGAKIDQQSQDRGSSALIDACTGKAIDIVKDLIAEGADVNLKSKDGQSGLVIAVGLNDEETAAALLEAGANPDDPDALGASARKYAALFNKPGMIALFKAHDAEK